MNNQPEHSKRTLIIFTAICLAFGFTTFELGKHLESQRNQDCPYNTHTKIDIERVTQYEPNVYGLMIENIDGSLNEMLAGDRYGPDRATVFSDVPAGEPMWAKFIISPNENDPTVCERSAEIHVHTVLEINFRTQGER